MDSGTYILEVYMEVSNGRNLKMAFEGLLEQQRQEPEMLFSIMPDWVDSDDNMGEEYDVLLELLNGITNCSFSPETGNELFPNNGRPQLILELGFYDVYNNGAMERLQKLQALPIYSKFIHLRVDTDFSPFEHRLYVNCGEDSDAMTEICGMLIHEVYGVGLTKEWDFMVVEEKKKKDAMKKAIKKAKNDMKNNHLRVVRIK